MVYRWQCKAAQPSQEITNQAPADRPESAERKAADCRLDTLQEWSRDEARELAAGNLLPAGRLFHG
jgi:hypothetical protein